MSQKSIRVFDKWHDIKIPDTVEEICENAFENLDAMSLSITFGKNVKKIPRNLFRDCLGITVYLPKELKKMPYAEWIEEEFGEDIWV